MFKHTINTPTEQSLLEQVAYALSRNGYLHFLNLETQQVQTLNEIKWGTEDIMYEIEEKPDAFLQIIPISDQERQQIRRRFTLKLADQDIREELLAAIESYTPTPTWRKALAQYGDVQAQWHYFRDNYFLNLAQKWLYENGLAPTPKINN